MPTDSADDNLVQLPVGARFDLDHDPTPQEREELVRFAAEADAELRGAGRHEGDGARRAEPEAGARPAEPEAGARPAEPEAGAEPEPEAGAGPGSEAGPERDEQR